MIGLFQGIASYTITHILVTFLSMGAWAAYANHAHSMPFPLVAGLVQGTFSACITLGMKTAIDYLQIKFSGHRQYWAPPLATFLGTACLLWTVHRVFGTPEILKTISIPLLIGTTYSLGYNYFTLRNRHAS